MGIQPRLRFDACALLRATPSRRSARPAPRSLNEAKRLVLVTTETMDATPATMQWFERASTNDQWRALGAAEPALVGRAGVAWAHTFRHFARPGEPIKVEGDKRAPAGVYPIGENLRHRPVVAPGPYPGHRRHRLRR